MKRWIKITLISSLSIFVVLAGTLAVHIYMVTSKAPELSSQNIQLGKITFPSGIDSTNVAEVRSSLYSIPGITKVVVNDRFDNAVFAYDNTGELSHDKVYEAFKNKMSIPAELYRPSEETLAGSCPVIDKSSVTYKVGSFFENIFASNK